MINVLIYENQRNTQSNDIFSLQSDKYVSKDDVVIDKCLQVLSTTLNNLSLNSSLIFFHQLWCWAMVDIQLLNVLLILLLTAQTAKHRKDSLCETKKSALLILRNTGFSSTNITIIVVEPKFISTIMSRSFKNVRYSLYWTDCMVGIDC
ncbi:unnamed protein product [Rotaria magnacalcarata]